MCHRIRKLKGYWIFCSDWLCDVFQFGPISSVVGEAGAESWKHVLRGLWESALRLDELMRVSWDQKGSIRPRWKEGTHAVLEVSAAMQKNNSDEKIPLLPGFESLLLETPPDLRTGGIFAPQSLQNKLNRRVRHSVPIRNGLEKS
jgi:hypothetical protein